MDYSSINKGENLRSILRSADRGNSGGDRDRDRDRGRDRQKGEAVVDDVELSELVSLISSLDATYRGPNTTDFDAKLSVKPLTDNFNDNYHTDVSKYIACFRCFVVTSCLSSIIEY